eukprot:747597-Hanusia_phi.AAC.3
MCSSLVSRVSSSLVIAVGYEVKEEKLSQSTQVANESAAKDDKEQDKEQDKEHSQREKQEAQVEIVGAGEKEDDLLQELKTSPPSADADTRAGRDMEQVRELEGS